VLLTAVLLLAIAAAALPTLLSTLVAQDEPAPLPRDEPRPETRNAALWPFHSRDPWNHPLGSEARLAAINSPGFDPEAGASLHVGSWSHPVFIARPQDHVRNIFVRGNNRPVVRMRIPRHALPDPEADGHLHIIDESHLFVVEMYQATRLTNGDFEATAAVRNELRGDGVFRNPTGIRAYGGSALGGLIRQGELTDGIRHALAVAVNRRAMNRNGPRGRPFVWPACAADEDATKPIEEGGYGSEGNLFMGSLLAIPPDVDLVKDLGLPQSGPILEVARALQDYGAYIVDPTAKNMVFYAEPAAAAEVPVDFDRQLSSLLAHLKVVTNNAPRSIGGGGTPRRPLAPPFPRLDLRDRP
jgi:hypothetical protein